MPDKMTKKRRVVITGLGVVAPNGIGKDEFWQANIKGKSGVDKITRFDASGLPVQIAGELKKFDSRNYIGIKNSKKMDLFTQYGVVTARLAVEDSKLKITDKNKERIGVVIGTAIGGIGFAEEEYPYFIKNNRFSAYTAIALDAGSCPSQISIELGIQGPSLTIATACASGSDVIGYAINLIKEKRTDVMLAGGA
ncbi:MAG: beta-ketoacyl-[acyl-carrier-protein] synthase II, partial [Candidatus Omnitrophica bacterium]|nr:beta-ketoacyl-[acyl-carrier-protein] synthase II [Candidatus Omnitrophota bacterium]